MSSVSIHTASRGCIRPDFSFLFGRGRIAQPFDLRQHEPHDGFNPGFECLRQLCTERFDVFRFDAYDNGLRDFFDGAAQGQRFEKIHLMQGIFSQYPSWKFVLFQPVDVSRFSLVPDAIDNDQPIRICHVAQQVYTQDATIDQGYVVGKSVFPPQPLNDANPESLIPIQDASDAKNHDVGRTHVWTFLDTATG